MSGIKPFRVSGYGKTLWQHHTSLVLIIFLTQDVSTCITRPAHAAADRKCEEVACASEFSP